MALFGSDYNGTVTSTCFMKIDALDSSDRKKIGNAEWNLFVCLSLAEATYQSAFLWNGSLNES